MSVMEELLIFFLVHRIGSGYKWIKYPLENSFCLGTHDSKRKEMVMSIWFDIYSLFQLVERLLTEVPGRGFLSVLSQWAHYSHVSMWFCYFLFSDW